MRIAHLSDTQIRNFQRHAEFRKSYEYLYASLREKKPDFIVVVGDIAHSKTHISPEFVELVVEYFDNLSQIAQLIVVPGNHDGNLNNLTRLDALTPVIKAMNNPRITYYKNSGVYSWRSGVNFVNFSCFDEDNWPTKDHPLVKTDAINIGLYHGMVKGAILQNGQSVEDCLYTVKEFLEIVDYLMMGDIHRMQVIDGKFRAAYCGSYPQQSFGEQVTKGYLIWDIDDKNKHEVDFVKLPTVCPYYIVELPDDLLLTEQLDIQDGARIRIDSRQLTPAEKNSLRLQVQKLYKPYEINFKDESSAHKQQVKISKNIKIEDLSDLGVQEKLFRKFFERLKLKDPVLNRICELNKKYDSAIRQEEEVIRNVQYKLGMMTWDNILSYGEGNSFDFSKRQGIVGVFGKNAVGKSSLAVDIPLYALFNANSKGVVKNDHLINDKKESCNATINVGIGDLVYRIKRDTDTYLKSGKKKGTPVYQGRTKLEYDVFDRHGTKIENKDDEQRQATDKEIRKIFGTAEDTRATSIAAQFDLLNFINKKDTERQKIIGRYFDVDSFEKKHALANDDAKEIKGQLKALEKDFQAEKESIVEMVKLVDKLMDEKKEGLIRYRETQKRFSSDAEHWSEKILKVVLDESKTPEELAEIIQTKKVDCLNKKNEIDNIEFSKRKLEQRLGQLLEKIDEVDIDELEKDRETWKKKAGSPNKSKVSMYKLLIESSDESLAELQKYECITNLNCCMLEEVARVEEEKASTISEQAQLFYEIRIFDDVSKRNLEPLEIQISDYRDNINVSLDLTALIENHDSTLATHKQLLEKMVAEVKDLENQKQLFIDNKNQIEKNNEYRTRVAVLKQKRDDAAAKVRETEGNISTYEYERAHHWENHTKAEEDEKAYNVLKAEHDAYFYYLEATGKDGLSRIIINNNLGIINVEIEKILSGNVDFDIEVDANEVGKIEIYFKHEKSKARRIELCSGMEKTIAAIAIRAALVCVTTLPKANVFILD